MQAEVAGKQQFKHVILSIDTAAGPEEFKVARDDGASWDMEHPVEFYNPGRAIGGRACPRTVELDDRTLGTIYDDTDETQPGGSGVFFRMMPMANLKP